MLYDSYRNENPFIKLIALPTQKLSLAITIENNLIIKAFIISAVVVVVFFPLSLCSLHVFRMIENLRSNPQHTIHRSCVCLYRCKSIVVRIYCCYFTVNFNLSCIVDALCCRRRRDCFAKSRFFPSFETFVDFVEKWFLACMNLRPI